MIQPKTPAECYAQFDYAMALTNAAIQDALINGDHDKAEAYVERFDLLMESFERFQGVNYWTSDRA